jgi:hypothetical protein
MSSHRNRRTQLPNHSPIADRHVIVDAVTQLVNLLNDGAVSNDHAARSVRHEATTTVTRLSAGSLPGYDRPFVYSQQCCYGCRAAVNLQAMAGYDSKSLPQVVQRQCRGQHAIVGAGHIGAGDGIDWLLVQHTAARSVVNGWVPITDRRGMRLLAPTAVAKAVHIRRPLAEQWLLSQGWGAWPELYTGKSAMMVFP